jgi:hypothetical protein
MFQFTYKLKFAEWVKAKCERHPPFVVKIEAGCETA